MIALSLKRKLGLDGFIKMKAILFLALVASASAVPFLDRLNREGLLQRVETTTIDFAPGNEEDINAPEHMSWAIPEEIEVNQKTRILEMVARRRQHADEMIETTTVDFSPWVEDMGAPEHMSWPVANDNVVEELVETTTVDFSPWENMDKAEHIPDARREQLRARLEEMVHRRA